MDNKIITGTAGKRRFVVADIHGCAQTFIALIEKRIRLTAEDQLFLLGDYIDRGKDNAGVLDCIMNLIRQNYQVFPLRGNHEEMLLDAWSHYKNTSPVDESEKFSDRLFDAFDLLDEQENLNARYAGFNFKSKYPFTDYTSMVWVRNFNYNPTPKTIIHGHQVTPMHSILQNIRERSPIIPLDNGCYYGLHKQQKFLLGLTETGLGKLCCLNLDTFELITQENID